MSHFARDCKSKDAVVQLGVLHTLLRNTRHVFERVFVFGLKFFAIIHDEETEDSANKYRHRRQADRQAEANGANWAGE